MSTIEVTTQAQLDKGVRACDPCRQRQLAKWPPAGMCEPHYRAFSKVDRANADRRRYFASVLRDIARTALDQGERDG